MKKPWGGRFRGGFDPKAEAFTASLSFDRRLYAHDIAGSAAHCKALHRAGILSAGEKAALLKGLARVKTEIDSGRFRFDARDEDIHMAVERRLTRLVGAVGGKLHTGRSRNDQVALDLRMYLREVLGRLEGLIRSLEKALLLQARKNLGAVMPGYTHMQRAQPVLLSHHFLAYVEMLERDRGRVRDAASRLDEMPLGSGALAGSNYPVDRRYVARLLGFSRITENSLDGVSDRDFVLEALSAASILMMHLSRLSEEMILWSTEEFGFVELPDALCTGSSMMPQKKNPDIPELVRGKTGRVYGRLMGMLTIMKGLPLSYNRDLQEDKEAVFDAMDTAVGCAALAAEMIRGLSVRRERMRSAAAGGHLLATELADYLVRKKLPFREAHEVVGRLVRRALDQGRSLPELGLSELQSFSPLFGPDALDALDLQKAVDRKDVPGGTARRRVAARLRALERSLRLSR